MSESGYRKPPLKTRFRKGQSGNPRGRPPGRRKALPYEAVLGQMVTVREGGQDRRMTAAEAFLLQLARRGLEGDGAAGRATMAAIEQAHARGLHLSGAFVSTITVEFVDPGSVSRAVEALRIGRKLDTYGNNPRIALEPWVVEAALGGFGSERLSREEQQTIVRATRTPHKVEWPEWWEVRE